MISKDEGKRLSVNKSACLLRVRACVCADKHTCAKKLERLTTKGIYEARLPFLSLTLIFFFFTADSDARRSADTHVKVSRYNVPANWTGFSQYKGLGIDRGIFPDGGHIARQANIKHWQHSAHNVDAHYYGKVQIGACSGHSAEM